MKICVETAVLLLSISSFLLLYTSFLCVFCLHLKGGGNVDIVENKYMCDTRYIDTYIHTYIDHKKKITQNGQLESGKKERKKERK